MRLAILIAAIAATAAAQADPYGRARDLYSHGDYDRAIATLEQAEPADERGLELLGRCYMMETEYRKATEVLERAVALEPDSSMANLWLGRAYGRRAETSFAFSALSLASKAQASVPEGRSAGPE